MQIMEISVPMMLLGLVAIAAAGALCGWWLETGRGGLPCPQVETKGQAYETAQSSVEETHADDTDRRVKDAA
ncbi:MAG TPA: hypothetical protein VFB33_08365 [Candidatus Binataceae bacterium]|nr:hypothetical protein [Candidatus Binataceae bacterium]